MVVVVVVVVGDWVLYDTSEFLGPAESIYGIHSA